MKKRTDPPQPQPTAATIHKLYRRRFRRATRDDGLAADLCQKLWLKMAGHKARHGEPDDERQLTNVAATSLIKDWWRQEKRVVVEPLPEHSAKLVDNATPSPEDELAKAKWRIAVRAELNRVVKSEKQRQLLLAGKKAVTLARHLGMTPAAIRKRRSRLIQRLRHNPRLRELWLEAIAA